MCIRDRGVALERLSAEQRQAAERLELLLDDRNQVSQEYMAARQQLTDLRPQLTALEAEDAQGKQLLDDLQKQTAADHSALASIRNRLQDARVELESTAARTTMMAERMQQLDADMGRMQQELAANEDEQKHLLDVITASKTSTEQLAASSTALLAELPVSYTHLRAHETRHDLVCRLLLEKKNLYIRQFIAI